MRATCLVLGLLASGCARIPDTDGTDEVFEMNVACSLDGAPCTPTADGHSPMFVQLCLVSEADRVDSLMATVRLSTGTWQIPDLTQATVARVELRATHCLAEPPVYATRSFLPGRTPGFARIDAEVGTFSLFTPITLRGAPLGAPELRPALFDLAQADTIALTALVRAEHGGLPSDGSRVTFATVDPVPSGAFATVFPTTVTVDPTGSAMATLQTDSALTEITVRVTATPPQAVTDQPVSRTTELRLRALP